MWCDTLQPGYGWSSLWCGYVRCRCGGLRMITASCPACASPPPSSVLVRVDIEKGVFQEVPDAFAGAEGRYEDYVYLQLMEREWKRPGFAEKSMQAPSIGGKTMSDRASIVLLFWTYFESRIGRLVDLGLVGVPSRVRDDILGRYAAVGARMDRLYKLLFDTTYHEDLNAVGASNVATVLSEIQRRRNEFVHGNPVAITDDLVGLVVRSLKDEHEAWLAVFNRRVSLSTRQA